MKVLVVTVGTSPLPALLSVLTHANPECDAGLALDPATDRVVLVHSGEGAQPYPDGALKYLEGLSWSQFGSWPSEQMRAFLQLPGSVRFAGLILVALRKIRPDLRVELYSIGTSESDISTIRARFAALSAQYRDVDTWMLDYTGGTSAMTAAAIDWHLSLDNVEGARTYVDYTSNKMLHTNPKLDLGVTELHVAHRLWTGDQFSIDLVAFIHGFYLTTQPRPVTAQLTGGEQHEAEVSKAVSSVVRSHARVIAQPGQREAPCCAPLLDPGFPGRLRRDQHRDVEVADNVSAHALSSTEEDTVTEFDTVVRWGCRVFVVEAKFPAAFLEVEGGWRIRASSFVFGALTTSLFVYARDRRGGANNPYTAALLDRATGRRLLETTVAGLYQTGSDLFHSIFFPQPITPIGDTPPRPSRELFQNGVLVTGVGRQTLAAVTAVDAFLPSRQSTVVLLFGQQIDRAAKQAALRIIKSCAPGADVVPYQTPIGDEVRLSQRVRNLLGAATGSVVLDVTAGTKAVTAALVRARATAAPGSGLAKAALVVRDPRTRTISRFPDPAPGVATLPATLPWEQLLGDIATPVEPQPPDDDPDSRRLAHVGSSIASRIPEDFPIGWWRPGQWPLLPPACRYLALSIGDRLVMLVLPNADTRNADDARHLAIQADVAATYQFGEAAVTVLVNPWDNSPSAMALVAGNSPDKPWWIRQLVSGARPGLAIDLATPTLVGPLEAKNDDIQWLTDRQIWRQLSTVRTVLAPWVRRDR